MAVQQVLNAQKIGFLLRGGVRVLVAVRDMQTGERPGAPHGQARAGPCRAGRGRQALQAAPLTVGMGWGPLQLPTTRLGITPN